MSTRGWALLRAGLLAVAVALTAPVSPLVLVGVPLAVQLLAFHRREPAALAAAGLILLLAFAGLGEPQDPVWYAERGWALLVAGGFVAATVVAEEAGVLARSVTAVGVAAAGLAVVGLLRPGLVAELDWWIERELTTAAVAASGWLEALGADGAGGVGVARVLAWQGMLYPAFLGFASLAGLGVARFLEGRLAGRQEPLGPFREFRFADGLVWVAILGLVLFLVPDGEALSRLAQNALVFMGGLYVLRGVAVLFWLGAALAGSGWTAAVWVAAGVLLYPLALALALMLGVGDTWVDVRHRLLAVLSGAKRR